MTAFNSFEQLLMTWRGLIKPKIALNCSILMDIDFRAILSDFLINKNFSSKIQLFMKNRNLGRNFVWAESHWILTLGQFWENFRSRKIFPSKSNFSSRIDLYQKNMCMTQSLGLKTLQMTMHGFKWLKSSSKWL